MLTNPVAINITTRNY